uniref:Protein krueppel n=1 Tax=Anopheles dirus TaxID=7168 RepID=A0A182NBF1_9DIPT
MLTSWQNWCRLCANETPSVKLESLDEINAILSSSLNFAIDDIKDISLYICEECLGFVNKLERFKERCQQSNRLFIYLSKCSRVCLLDLDLDEVRSKYLEEVSLDEVTEQLLGDLNAETQVLANIDPLRENQHINDMLKAGDETTEVFYQVESLTISSSRNDFDNSATDTEQWETLEVEMEECNNDTDGNDEGVAEEECLKDPDYSHESEKSATRTPRRQLINVMIEKSPSDENDANVRSKRHRGRPASNKSASQQSYECEVCGKTFSSNTYLKKHQTIHMPHEAKHQYPCPLCDKLFTKSINLKTHIRLVHGEEKPFICEECGKPFGSRGALKEHYIVHMEDRPFNCGYCSKRFKNAARLKTHEDTHNDTMYVCPHCGLKLNTKRTLNMHMVVHSDQKKYKCQECGNEYKRSKSLKAHLILHTGLRPYQCPFCDRSFANGSNCRSHKKKFHPRELAALEASGGHKPAANIPKLEHLQRKNQSEGEMVEITRKHIVRSSAKGASGSRAKQKDGSQTFVINQLPEGSIPDSYPVKSEANP